MKAQNLALESVSKQGPSEMIKSQIRVTKNFNQVFTRSYPNFQYSCPKCGTLDVILDLKNNDSMVARCLECKTKWMERYVQ